jgi:hypothetical protein
MASRYCSQLQILPLIGLTCFEQPKVVALPKVNVEPVVAPVIADEPDTVSQWKLFDMPC